jgi:hypothetical protein
MPRVTERSGVKIIVDQIVGTTCFFRSWRTGSDGSADSDWDHFVGAYRAPLAQVAASLLTPTNTTTTGASA